MTPCPTWKSPTSATMICFDSAVVTAVVVEAEPDAPKSRALIHDESGCAAAQANAASRHRQVPASTVNH